MGSFCVSEEAEAELLEGLETMTAKMTERNLKGILTESG
jgi:hypothetical protein